MNLKILASAFLMTLLIFSPSIAKASTPQTVMAMDDTFVVDQEVDSVFGDDPYLVVANSFEGLAFAFLMFNLSGVSYEFNASSVVRLALRCFNATSLHVIGVYWCLNNAWNENNLTYVSSGNLRVAKLVESYVSIFSNDAWYEWTVTQTVRAAFANGYNKLSLVLKVESTHTGYEYVSFYSKEASPVGEYGPRLVFSYFTPSNFMDIAIKIVFASIVIIGIIIVAYRFSKKKKREKYYRKSRFQHKSVRSTK